MGRPAAGPLVLRLPRSRKTSTLVVKSQEQLDAADPPALAEVDRAR
jgi:hypothetical protein